MTPLFTWLLVFVRTSAFFILFPLFASGMAPARVRIALAAFIALAIAPQLDNPVDPASLTVVDVVVLLAKEIGAGLILGYLVRLIFYAIQLAGHFISTEIGLQTSTLLIPTDSVAVDVPGAVLNLLAMMLFLTMDIHHAVLLQFRDSYALLPIGGEKLSNELMTGLTARVSGVFLLAVEIAAPLIAIGFLVAVVLMMLGRAVPQMNVFLEGFTVRIIAGLFVFGLAVELAAQRIAGFFHALPGEMAAVSRLVAGH